MKFILLLASILTFQWTLGMTEAPASAHSLYAYYKLEGLQRGPRELKKLLGQKVVGPAGWWYQAETLNQGSSVYQLAFDKDDSHLAVACENTTVKVLDIAGNLIWHKNQKFLHERGYCADIAFNPLNNHLAIAAGSERVDLWNPLGGAKIAYLSERIATVNHDTDDLVLASAFNQKGSLFATASGIIKVWDEDLNLIATAPLIFRNVWNISFAPQSNYLAISADDNLHIWDIDSNAITSSLYKDNKFGVIAFHPHRNLLATGSNFGDEFLWDLESLNPGVIEQPSVRFEPRPCHASRAIAFHPNGELVAIGYVVPGVILWNLKGERLLRIPHDVVVTSGVWFTESQVNSAVFNRKGTLLATGCRDHRVIKWEQHEQFTLEQVLLRCILKEYLKKCVEDRVNPEVTCTNKDDLVPWMAKKFNLKKDELKAVWSTMPELLQTSIVKTVLYRASKIPHDKK